MTSLLRADLLKLRKRPMGWVMLIIIALFVPLLMLPSAFLSPGNVNYAFPAGFLEGLTPLPFVGTFIMIVLGAMLVGTEYGYDTWLGGLLPLASLSSSIGVLQAQITGVALSNNGSITQVHLGGALAGLLWIVPGLLLVAYLVIPIAIAAFLFRRRDMLGVG